MQVPVAKTQSAYESYRKYCLSIEQEPAPIEVWNRTTKSISDYQWFGCQDSARPEKRQQFRPSHV